MVAKKKKPEGYRSELDIFFHHFDEHRQLPQSRLDEIKKHESIAFKRDNPVEQSTSSLWERFL